MNLEDYLLHTNNYIWNNDQKISTIWNLKSDIQAYYYNSDNWMKIRKAHSLYEVISLSEF